MMILAKKIDDSLENLENKFDTKIAQISTQIREMSHQIKSVETQIRSVETKRDVILMCFQKE